MDSIPKLIAKVLKIAPERVTADMAMKHTPEWDSLKHIELILALEQACNIELTGDEIADMVSVQAIQKILKARGVQ